ncbi:hypothetical protein BDR07DRAFT_982116, partial [Suillus spraguei]
MTYLTFEFTNMFTHKVRCELLFQDSIFRSQSPSIFTPSKDGTFVWWTIGYG